jgi:hypothetical protein
MKAKLPLAVLVSMSAALLGSQPASAQNVYKCASGYSQSPCAADATPLQVADPRTAEQKRQADAATQRDARLADAMEKDRVRREAATASTADLQQVKARGSKVSAQGAGTGKSGNASKRKKASKASSKTGAAGETFVATDGKKKPKASKSKSRSKAQGAQKTKSAKATRKKTSARKTA